MTHPSDHRDHAPDRRAAGMPPRPASDVARGHDLLASAAASNGDRPALISARGQMTWKELDQAVNGAVDLLLDAGVAPGDTVAFVLSSPGQAVMLMLAGLRLRLTTAPLSTRMPEAALREACRTLGSPVLVAENDGPIDPSRLVPVFGGNAAVSQGSGPIPGVRRGQPVRTTHPLPEPEHSRDTHARTAVLTSGSSGDPRAVLHPIHAHVAGALGAVQTLGFGVGDRWLLSLPLFHVGGLAVLFRALVSGGAMVLPDADESMLATVTRQQVTHCSLVSTQLVRALEHDQPVPGSLRCVLMGGGPLGVDLMRHAASLGWPVRPSYGLTETASLVTCTEWGDPIDALATAGRVLRGRSVRVDDRGHILVGGPVLAEGILRNGRAEPLETTGGMFDTRDLGKLDADGRLIVSGRADARFISGGENIQPEAIERVLAAQPGVRQAIVVPVPDPEFVARPFAWIDGSIDRDMLDSAVRRQLPGYMAPVDYRAMPADAAGAGLKPSRTRLAEAAALKTGR